MQIIKNKLKVYLITAIIFMLGVTVLHTIMLFISFDKDIGYFQSGLISSITNALSVSVVVWFFSALFFIPKKTMKADMPQEKTLVRAAYVFSAFINAFGLLYVMFNTVKAVESNQIITKTQMLSLLFLTLSILYFIGKAFKIFKTDTTVFFGFFIILQSITILADLYFDNNVQMNSPLKITMQLSLLFIMLYFLGDFRFDLKKPYPRVYLIISLSAFFVCSATSIPHVIAFFAGILDNKDYFVKNIYILISGLYIFIRSSLYVKHNITEAYTDQEKIETAE